LTACVVATLAARAAECPIDGQKAIKAAKSQGFTFKFERDGASGECDQGDDDSWFLASASASDPLKCHAVLFGDGGLSDNWHVVRIVLTGAAVLDRVDPKRGTRNLAAKFTLASPPGQDKQVSLKTVVLDGPDCDKWEDAFAQ
jgi:hypothetical protein